MTETKVATDLFHYAAKAIELRAEKREQKIGVKPSGLWLSVGTGWEDWCRDEDFRDMDAAVKHRVTLAADASVRLITTAAELDEFTASYARPYENWTSRDRQYYPIDWRHVASFYQGIIIAPYQYTRRYDLDWHYGWDCASGCIWDTNAIESVEVVS